MPTAGKLIAALCFGALAWVVADLYEPALDEAQRGQWFAPAAAVIGLFVGWFTLGPKIGGTVVTALWRGVASSVWLVFWAAFWFSGYEMILRALDKRYRTPTEAVTGVLDIAYFYLELAVTPEVIGTLLVGGAVAGILTMISNRLWK